MRAACIYKTHLYLFMVQRKFKCQTKIAGEARKHVAVLRFRYDYKYYYYYNADICNLSIPRTPEAIPT